MNPTSEDVGGLLARYRASGPTFTRRGADQLVDSPTAANHYIQEDAPDRIAAVIIKRFG